MTIEQQDCLKKACQHGKEKLHFTIQVLDSLYLKGKDLCIPECILQCRELLRLCHIAMPDITIEEPPPKPDTILGAPRRCQNNFLTEIEKEFNQLIAKVEMLEPHPSLTEAVILLGQAKDRVADFVELKPHPRTLTPE